MPDHSLPVVMTIAGSDSGGGAGIQADLKTFADFHCHGLSAITAITAQNSRGVIAVSAISADMVMTQLNAVFDDFHPLACKTGMLANASILSAVADCLADKGLDLVVDPVLVSTSGDLLFSQDAVDLYCQRMLPLAKLLTPNLHEASVLAGMEVTDLDSMRKAAARLMGMGCSAVLMKGGHLQSDEISDLLMTAEGEYVFSYQRLPGSFHGTGCTLAAAIAASLARGHGLAGAVAEAENYLHGLLDKVTRPGKGEVCFLPQGVRFGD